MRKMDREAQQKIQAGRMLVANTLLTTLAENLDRSGKQELAAHVRASCARDWREHPSITIRDEALKPYTLRIYLANVPRDYNLSLLVPPGYENHMRRHFALFRSAVDAFWTEWLSTQEAHICAAMPPLKLRETAFYWDSTSDLDTSQWTWFGIMHHYETAGNQFYRS